MILWLPALLAATICPIAVLFYKRIKTRTDPVGQKLGRVSERGVFEPKAFVLERYWPLALVWVLFLGSYILALAVAYPIVNRATIGELSKNPFLPMIAALLPASLSNWIVPYLHEQGEKDLQRDLEKATRRTYLVPAIEEASAAEEKQAVGAMWTLARFISYLRRAVDGKKAGPSAPGSATVPMNFYPAEDLAREKRYAEERAAYREQRQQQYKEHVREFESAAPGTLCPACGGYGKTWVECSYASNNGRTGCFGGTMIDSYGDTFTCTRCNGTGGKDQPCFVCKGARRR